MYKSFAVDGLGHFHLCKDSAEQLFLWHFPIRKKQGWEFTLLLFALSLKIAHMKERLWVIWATLSELLLSLFTKEQPWVNCSHPPVKNKQHEWFTCFLQFSPCFYCFSPFYKRVGVRELLTTKEWWEHFNLFYKGISLSHTKNKRFNLKTKEQIPNTGWLQ